MYQIWLTVDIAFDTKQDNLPASCSASFRLPASATMATPAPCSDTTGVLTPFPSSHSPPGTCSIDDNTIGFVLEDNEKANDSYPNQHRNTTTGRRRGNKVYAGLFFTSISILVAASSTSLTRSSLSKICNLISKRNGSCFCLYDYYRRQANERRLKRQSQGSSIEHSIDTTSKVRVTVYSTLSTSGSPSYRNEQYLALREVAQKQKDDLESSAKNLGASSGRDGSSIEVVSINYLLDFEEQQHFVLKNCGSSAYERIQELRNSNNGQQWVSIITQWCALVTATSNDNSLSDAVIFIDPTGPIILNHRYSHDLFTYLNDLIRESNTTSIYLPNVAVRGTEGLSETIHGSFLILQKTKENYEMAKQMLVLSLSTGATFEALELNAILFSQSLYSLIRNQSLSSSVANDEWYFLENRCRTQPLRRQLLGTASTSTNLLSCPASSGYCCSVKDRNGDESVIVVMSQHLVLPVQTLNYDYVRYPYNFRNVTATTARNLLGDDEIPFISTITETVIPKPAGLRRTPTFYEILETNQCVPNDLCSVCLQTRWGANCYLCKTVCPCYCNVLCNPDKRPHPQHVAKNIVITPPPYRRDPTRLIPRIVHQTWSEEVTPTRYPKMSRLVQSFVHSGWEYKFYSDAQAVDFLSIHFPPEVLEAYNALIPGAFKADLFRYCVLLIHGGFYADIDVQLETSLDSAIAPDIGFMVPMDEVRQYQ